MIKKTVARLPLPAVLPLVEEVSVAKVVPNGFAASPVSSLLPLNFLTEYINNLLINPHIETQCHSQCNWPRFKLIKFFTRNTIYDGGFFCKIISLVAKADSLTCVLLVSE